MHAWTHISYTHALHTHIHTLHKHTPLHTRPKHEHPTQSYTHPTCIHMHTLHKHNPPQTCPTQHTHTHTPYTNPLHIHTFFSPTPKKSYIWNVGYFSSLQVFFPAGFRGLTSWGKFWQPLKFTLKQSIRKGTNAKEVKIGLKVKECPSC